MRQRLKRWIFDGAIAGMEGFVEGCVSSSILLIACKSGTFGNALNGASPYTLATVVSHCYDLAHQAMMRMISFAYIVGSMAGGMLANTGYENRKEIVLEMRDGAGIEAIMLVLLSYPPLFRYMLITKPGM